MVLSKLALPSLFLSLPLSPHTCVYSDVGVCVWFFIYVRDRVCVCVYKCAWVVAYPSSAVVLNPFAVFPPSIIIVAWHIAQFFGKCKQRTTDRSLLSFFCCCLVGDRAMLFVACVARVDLFVEQRQTVFIYIYIV